MLEQRKEYLKREPFTGMACGPYADEGVGNTIAASN